MARANSLSSSDSGPPCGAATDVASVSQSSASSDGSESALRPLNETSIWPGHPGWAMSPRSLATAARRSAAGSGRSPAAASMECSAARASASAAAQSARKASSCSSSSTVIGTRPSGSGLVIHRSCSVTYSRRASSSPVASRSGSISPAASSSSRWPTSLACISSCSGLRVAGSAQTCSPMIPVGSVPVASSQPCTSPKVASCSLIFCRIVSAESQNGADSGFPAASSPRLMVGSDASASAAGTLSNAIATSRRRSSATRRWARSATRSAWSSTPRSVRRSRPKAHGPPVFLVRLN